MELILTKNEMFTHVKTHVNIYHHEDGEKNIYQVKLIIFTLKSKFNSNNNFIRQSIVLSKIIRCKFLIGTFYYKF